MQKETAVLVMTDLHYGKKTKSFDPEVFNKRMLDVNRKLARIKDLLAGYEIDKLVVPLLGDVNDGSGIYPTQEHHQEVTNVEQQAWILSDTLADFFKKQKEIWGAVEIEAVPGNHGRVGKFAHEAANWDIVAYKYLRLKLQESGIPVRTNTEGDQFIRKVQIRGHNFVLYHGHDIRSYSSIPWYGMLLRISRWLSTSLAPFDLALMGHFHSFGRWKINNVELMLSGTMVSDDEWALRTLGWESATRWWLFGVSNKFPVTWQYGVELE